MRYILDGDDDDDIIVKLPELPARVYAAMYTNLTPLSTVLCCRRLWGYHLSVIQLGSVRRRTYGSFAPVALSYDTKGRSTKGVKSPP